jgi:hypothetical protein
MHRTTDYHGARVYDGGTGVKAVRFDGAARGDGIACGPSGGGIGWPRPPGVIGEGYDWCGYTLGVVWVTTGGTIGTPRPRPAGVTLGAGTAVATGGVYMPGCMPAGA